MAGIINFFFELYSSLEFWKVLGILFLVDNIFDLQSHPSNVYPAISLFVNLAAGILCHFVKRSIDNGNS